MLAATNGEALAHTTSILLLGAGPETSRLQKMLAKHFLTVERARSLDETIRLTRRCRFHRLVLVDPELPWQALREDLDACEGLPPDIVVIIDRSRADSAVDALRDGVADVLMRPFSGDELVTALAAAPDRRAARPRSRPPGAQHELLGNSRAIQAAKALIERLAPTPAPVLVAGEAGTGRDLVAHLLHDLGGRQGPFLHIDCDSVAPRELEAALFGPERGTSSTDDPPREGALLAASGGTLYLDAVHEMPVGAQARLRHVLEEKAMRPPGMRRAVRIDCRIVASTGANPAEYVAKQRLREDLYRCRCWRSTSPTACRPRWGCRR